MTRDVILMVMSLAGIFVTGIILALMGKIIVALQMIEAKNFGFGRIVKSMKRNKELESNASSRNGNNE